MQPERKEFIGDRKVEEYYWSGKFVVYVDSHRVDMPFDKARQALLNGEELRWAE